MTILLHLRDLSRTHLAQGELALRYCGRDVPAWTGRLEGQRPGVLAIVTRDDVALPPTLEVCAEDAGVRLADHPQVPRLRVLVAEALLSAQRTRAPELIEELSDLETRWAPGEESRAKRMQDRAFDEVARKIHRIADDLALQARRRRARELMHEHHRVDRPSSEARQLLERMERGPIAPAPSEPWRFDPALLERLRQAIERARHLDLPQRLPSGARRTLLRLPRGIYLSEDGLLRPMPSLSMALERAADLESHALERAVIDWDGEWPVLCRSFGAEGRSGYDLERELDRGATPSAMR